MATEKSVKAVKQNDGRTEVEKQLDALLTRAKAARDKYLELDQEAIDRITKAMAPGWSGCSHGSGAHGGGRNRPWYS